MSASISCGRSGNKAGLEALGQQGELPGNADQQHHLQKRPWSVRQATDPRSAEKPDSWRYKQFSQRRL
jgi:hypothetical protein